MNSNKAVLAAVLAGLATLLADLRGADDMLTVQDVVITLLAAVVVGIGVYLTPPGPGLRTPPPVRRGQAGYGAVELVVGVLLVVILVVVLLRLL